jgi:hypothetical protein
MAMNSVPEGYMLVPKKLTDEMQAVVGECTHINDPQMNELTLQDLWSLLLAKAPVKDLVNG